MFKTNIIINNNHNILQETRVTIMVGTYLPTYCMVTVLAIR